MESNELITNNAKKKLYLIINIVVFLISGTASLIFGKILYEISAIGKPDLPSHTFQKPWFSNLMMFIGMTFLLIQHILSKKIRKQKIEANVSMYKVCIYTMAPSFCDASASFLMFLGLLWIPISIWQMIRGSIVLFTGLIRVYFLKKPLKKYEWCGIIIVVIALIIVGVSSIYGSDSNTSSISRRIIGICLVLLAQFIQSTQTVIEEYLLQGVNIESELIVGLEGLWGLIMTSCIFMPIAQFLPGEEGSSLHEDTIDSFYMLKNSIPILMLNLTSIIALLFLNYGSMNITLYSNSVTRTILEPVRTFFVWISAVLIYYISGEKYLEGLNYMSILQLFGFLVLIVGLFIYNSIWKLKCFKYNDEIDEIEKALI